jgi:hypothetical protein
VTARPSAPARARGRPGLALLLAALLLATPFAARAEVPLVEGDDVQFSLAGYVRTLTGYQRLPYDTLGLVPDESGLASSVVRFEWRLNLGERVTLQVHDRFFFRLTTAETAVGGGLGIGVSQPPGRHVDLESTLLEGDGFLLRHDVDRLVLRVYADFGDFALGRQAITWGYGALFPVADLWTTFSPFELDTSEKRGVDAVRFLTTLGERWELDVVVADKGELEDLSGGVRATVYLPTADVYVALAKIWEELLLFAGVQADLGTFGLRAEVVAPFDLDDAEVLLPRAVAGFDYFGGDFLLSFEVHFNGLGADEVPEGYRAVLAGEEVARGETYLVGRYYAGVLASYKLTELVSLAATGLVNLQDPSAIFSVTATYQVASNADIVAGAFVPVGAEPELARLRLNSEFGTYGQLFYAQLSAYW